MPLCICCVSLLSVRLTSLLRLLGRERCEFDGERLGAERLSLHGCHGLGCVGLVVVRDECEGTNATGRNNASLANGAEGTESLLQLISSHIPAAAEAAAGATKGGSRSGR